MTPKTTCLSPYRCHREEKHADPDGFSSAAVDALRVGRREAFGVQQLAAALSLCANIVPGTRSA
ncbi:MAG: hypothetical protein GX456_13435 [Verrucomicrobia bacterium]|nr:hypothetical protein [Verrucomicrobiota bacterium]